MNTTRRNLMRAAGGAAGAGAVPESAGGPGVPLQVRQQPAPSHPMNLRANEAAQNIARDTGGRFELAVFPSSQLGSDTDTLSQLRAAPSSSSPCPD